METCICTVPTVPPRTLSNPRKQGMREPTPLFALSPPILHRGEWVASNHPRKVFISSARRNVAILRRCRYRISAAASDADHYRRMEDFFGPSGDKFQKKRDQTGNGPSIPKNTSSSGEDAHDGAPVPRSKSREMPGAKAYKELAGILGPPGDRFQKNNQPKGAPPPLKKASKSAKKTPAPSPKPSISSEDVSRLREEDFSDDNAELSPEELAAQYDEMAQLLGPPTKRFQKRNGSKVSNSAPNGSDSRSPYSNSDPGDNISEAKSGEEEEQPLMRQIENAQEEFELIRSALRGGEASNKPRRGRRRLANDMAMKLEGIITEPYRTSYNLMPMSGPKEKRGPPRKGQKPLTPPDGYVFAIESIKQSYDALERVLEEEEQDWVREQERLRQIQTDKKEAKEERLRLRRGEPSIDASINDGVENEPPVNPKKGGKGKKSEKPPGLWGIEIINSLERPALKTQRVRTPTELGINKQSAVATPAPNATPKPTSTRRQARSKDPGVLLLRDPKLIA